MGAGGKYGVVRGRAGTKICFVEDVTICVSSALESTIFIMSDLVSDPIMLILIGVAVLIVYLVAFKRPSSAVITKMFIYPIKS